MWKPPRNFITLHYAYIITLSVLSLVILYPYGNMRAVDAYFFGASASTESGLNTIDLKALKTYQQVYLYVIPIISNVGFINILVVVVRLHWFEKRLKEVAPALLGQKLRRKSATEAVAYVCQRNNFSSPEVAQTAQTGSDEKESCENELQTTEEKTITSRATPSISFTDDLGEFHRRTKALRIPPPWERDRGRPILEIEDELSDCEPVQTKITDGHSVNTESSRWRIQESLFHPVIQPLERVTSSMFVIGASLSRGDQIHPQPTLERSLSQKLNLPELSSQATLGRNSEFHNLTAEDRDILGGIEYRSLKLLLKIVTGYFFGLQIFGAICLVGWIQHANPKYRQYLEECGQGSVWWGFYSSQTMINNLGFTLTPDSMVSFQDATFPLVLMSFLAYAGNTCYPCLLRLVIWIMSKVCPKESSLRESLDFLLKHPRRCYTLLFPSRPTWALFGILFVLNFVDVILILVLDLHNTAVNNLSAGPRILAAIFQAASSRHTGAAVFNLADVNPAVQLSLVVMMYIAVFPIAISVRASNTYEEKALGLYPSENEMNEQNGRSYVLTHIRNQLTFDLWYIFLGAFCICVAEASRIEDITDPAFSVFSVLFEVVSAYGNVGLSLGYPTVNTSLSGQFTTFSKLVTCAMMIRGRHRGLPYQLDRAILLPSERLVEDSQEDGQEENARWKRQIERMSKIRRFYTT